MHYIHESLGFCSDLRQSEASSFSMRLNFSSYLNNKKGYDDYENIRNKSKNILNCKNILADGEKWEMNFSLSHLQP